MSLHYIIGYRENQQEHMYCKFYHDYDYPDDFNLFSFYLDVLENVLKGVVKGKGDGQTFLDNIGSYYGYTEGEDWRVSHSYDGPPLLSIGHYNLLNSLDVDFGFVADYDTGFFELYFGRQRMPQKDNPYNDTYKRIYEEAVYDGGSMCLHEKHLFVFDSPGAHYFPCRLAYKISIEQLSKLYEQDENRYREVLPSLLTAVKEGFLLDEKENNAFHNRTYLEYTIYVKAYGKMPLEAFPWRPAADVIDLNALDINKTEVDQDKVDAYWFECSEKYSGWPKIE